jgi:hypothetical protein
MGICSGYKHLAVCEMFSATFELDMARLLIRIGESISGLRLFMRCYKFVL